jgi:hypothetical protein
MDLYKKILFAVSISIAMITTAPVALAAKVEKATAEAVVKIIEETITLSEETLEALQGGAEKEKLLALLKKTKQSSKGIESNIVDRLRQTANARLNKVRSAVKQDDNETAIAYMTEVVERFKEIQQKHSAF